METKTVNTTDPSASTTLSPDTTSTSTTETSANATTAADDTVSGIPTGKRITSKTK